MKASSLPPWAAEIVHHCPPQGQGVHRWLFYAALALCRCGWSEQDILPFLEIESAGCGRPVPSSEIISAIHNAEGIVRNGPSERPKQKKWSGLNQKLADSIGNESILADLWEKSHIWFEDTTSHSEEIIDVLFPGNPLLCIGRSKYEFHTLPREEWRGQLSSLQLIVPSPMSSKTGHTREGKESEHTLENTGPRRFLVIEFDQGTVDQHASCLLHLRDYAPLTLAVHSGGKSLHGWFCCEGVPEDRLRRFMDYAVSLGADPTTWTSSQFVRMPDGLRDNGKRQSVFFFDPTKTQK